MNDESLKIEELPRLKNPVFIAGFDGWGNALNVSRGMADFLISRLQARYFAAINADLFFRYDATRPVATIEEGILTHYRPPKGNFFVIETGEHHAHDIIVLSADEPNLAWNRLVSEILDLLKNLGAKTIITLGSMFDNVLHTDRTISALVSNDALKSLLVQKGVQPISYHGPSTIHSTIHWEGQKRGFECLSLWCHCPYYLQGTTHFGLLSALGNLLAYLGNFSLDTRSLEESWEKLEAEIQTLLKDNSQLREVVDKLQKTRTKRGRAFRQPIDPGEKIINLKDFLD
jgi:proteasome assembly chaperone (PAC2) family protein